MGPSYGLSGCARVARICQSWPSASHVWDTETDPDVSGYCILSLAKQLATMDCEVGVFMDYMSCYQVLYTEALVKRGYIGPEHEENIDYFRRTPRQESAFRRGLMLSNILYAHALTTVTVLSGTKVWWERAWPWVEWRVACLLKGNVVRVVRAHVRAAPSIFVLGGDLPPVGPKPPSVAVFEDELSARVFSGGNAAIGSLQRQKLVMIAVATYRACYGATRRTAESVDAI